MTAQIVIDDGTNPPAIGSTDNPSTFLATSHGLSNFDDTGILGWRWTLVDKPIGSAAARSATDTASVTLTPDVAGSYLVRLETYTDAARTIADDLDEQIIGVRFEGAQDWLVPAAGETVQQGTRGWAQSREEAIRGVLPNLWPEPVSSIVTAGPYTALKGQLVLYDPSGGSFTINAPASPVLGDRFAIKNTTTDATAVTVDGNGNSIENPSTETFVASYSLGDGLVSLDFIYDGTNWVLL